MNHYTIAEVEQHVNTCGRLGCIPKEQLDYFRALVDQANRAYEFYLRWERMLDVMAGAECTA